MKPAWPVKGTTPSGPSFLFAKMTGMNSAPLIVAISPYGALISEGDMERQISCIISTAPSDSGLPEARSL